MQRWTTILARTQWLWIAAWPILAACIWVCAPRIPTLLVDDDTDFLPADMPSQVGFARLQEEFPGHAPASRAVIVFHREAGLTDADRQVIGKIAISLAARSEELGWKIHAIATAPFLSPLLESEDGKAALIVVDLPAAFLTHSTVNRVREIQAEVGRHAHDSALKIDITGTAALGELLDANAKGDVDRTTTWAFAGVTFILLLIYRSPVAMLLPVLTVGLSLMVSLGILGFAAAAGYPINGLVEMFIVVIVAGSGVDYCLFLFARFREELSRGLTPTVAVKNAVDSTGGAILASAGTNAVGLATLALAHNRDLYTTGPAIAFAICVATAAVLTLTPSVMRIAGRYLTWPGAGAAFRKSRDSQLGATVEDDAATLRTPRQNMPAPPARAWHTADWAWHPVRLIARLLRRNTSAKKVERAGGFWAFVAGLAANRPVPVALLLTCVLLPTSIVALCVEPLFDSYEEYPADSSFVQGAKAFERHFFNGEGVAEQTVIITADIRLDTPGVMPVLREAVDKLAADLEAEFPMAYQRDLGDPLGLRRRRYPDGGSGPMARLAAGLADRAAREFYLGRSGRATRLEIGLRIEPRSAQAMDTVVRLRAAVRRILQSSALAEKLGKPLRVDLAGNTPIYADIRAVRTRDFRVIAVAAVILIYLILIWLIRSPVLSAILVAATLFTYLATYGATWAIIVQFFGVSSLSYQIDFLLFIIILSLGQDYNIYVVTRIREELLTKPPRLAVAEAVRRTGPVVSGCGIIMAAAFASMYSGSLLIMKEFAVALALGILIDTFLVRPLLVPSWILLVMRTGKEGAGNAPVTP